MLFTWVVNYFPADTLMPDGYWLDHSVLSAKK